MGEVHDQKLKTELDKLLSEITFWQKRASFYRSQKGVRHNR